MKEDKKQRFDYVENALSIFTKNFLRELVDNTLFSTIYFKLFIDSIPFWEMVNLNVDDQEEDILYEYPRGKEVYIFEISTICLVGLSFLFCLTASLRDSFAFFRSCSER